MSNLYIVPYMSSQLALDKQLEDRRCDLLAQIDSAIGSHGPTDSLSAANLKSLYNKTVDEQWSRRSGSFPDPLVAFPEDIWESIIAQVVDYTYDGWCGNSLLRLLDVSRLWMTKLISCPVLWTTITINPGEGDLLAKAAVYLYLSKQSNLKIEFTSTDQRQLPKELYDMLAPHTGRVVELSFHFWESDLFEQIVGVIQLIGHLPRLKWIRNEFTNENLNRLIQYVPYLRGVESVRLGVEDLIYPCPVLVDAICFKLSFRGKLPDIWYNYNHLRNLALWGGYICLLDILNRLNCPLVTLTVIEMPSKGFRAFLKSISRFYLLQSLQVTIYPRLQLQDVEFSTDVPLSILPIKSLWLSFHMSNEDADTVFEEHSEFDADVTSIVEHSMPHIESLGLWEVPITSGLLSMLQSLCRLQEMTIQAHGNLPSSTEHSPIDLPQLRHLIWDFNTANKFRSLPLIARSLSTCTVMDVYYEAPTKVGVASAILLPQGCSNSLVRLSINTSNSLHFLLGDLSALREVEFGLDAHNWWIGDILEQLIIFPSMCPALQKLIFQGICTEWDILFLALERRNFLKDLNVSPIREIHMTFKPPYRILYPLAQLLGGRFPSSPSVEQYATVAFEETSERQICYLCRLPSEELRKWDRFRESILKDWDWKHGYSIASEKANPPLKAPVKSWLASKSNRRRQVKESIQRSLNQGAQLGSCRNCDAHSGSMIVTAHFLDGA
ncbi:hypothetical protein FRC20_002552 [Serendipita sp. 405]|nr:hypothetical protein FRC16_005205 [Serendipita sp. 398]KAG8848338.1 hypothetical protein FRC20_002552 [Serendipita sp. 405]